MSPDAIPFLLATLFTVGCIAIHKTEKHADRVREMLGVLFVAAAALAVMAAVAHASGTVEILTDGFQELKVGDWTPAPPE